MIGELCEYCQEDPCACPVFEIEPDPFGPDEPYDDDSEDIPEEPDL
jgi:hypothetical protein